MLFYSPLQKRYPTKERRSCPSFDHISATGAGYSDSSLSSRHTEYLFASGASVIDIRLPLGPFPFLKREAALCFSQHSAVFAMALQPPPYFVQSILKLFFHLNTPCIPQQYTIPEK